MILLMGLGVQVQLIIIVATNDALNFDLPKYGIFLKEREMIKHWSGVSRRMAVNINPWARLDLNG